MRFRDLCRSLARFLTTLALPALIGLSADGAPPVRRSVTPSALPPSDERPVSTKLDPSLRRLVRDHERRASLAWALPSEERQPLIRTEYLANGDLAAGVFVRSTDVEKTKADISSFGGYVRVEAGDIVVAVLPVVALETLADRPENASIEASYFRKPLLNVSRPATKADQVHAGTGLSGPRTGAGVIVGIVDSGIYYQHEDFKTASGTRIRSIWDISGVSSGSSTPRICSQSEINAGTCTEKDVDGHGTHVAGTAAGNGRAQSGYVGMAPEAEIVAAKATRSTQPKGTFSDDDVIAACNYIFQQAQTAGKPAVINLSLGGHGGPLDGTSNWEVALSNMTGPGKIIVAAAGNSGDDRIHLSYAVSGSSFADSLESRFFAPAVGSEANIAVWYPSGSIGIGFAARLATDQTSNITSTAAVGPGQSTGVQTMTDPNGIPLAQYSIDASTTSSPGNGSRFVYIRFVPLLDLVFSMYTVGNGTFDAWALGNTRFSSLSGGFWRPGDFSKTVGAPSTAQKVLAVANYTTKTQWTGYNGQLVDRSTSGFSVGSIAASSSRGPTRDGRVKPEISAPGSFIAAAFSADSASNHTPDDVLQGGKLMAINGTSMAAPHVTGIVALMLQANPTLTYEQVLQTLQSTATKDSFTGSTTNNTWGAGKVNAYEAVKAVGGGGGGGTTTCAADTTTLCLGPSGRFKVQATYKDYGGNVGDGKVQKLTDNSGYFYFFDPTNVELVAKFVSFCNGSSGNWSIYASGLTDVEVKFKVTDTKTGLYKEYPNALGNRFCTIGDGAFTCP